MDGALAYGLNGSHQNLYLHSTYLFHTPNAFTLDNVWLNNYFGIGGRLVSRNDDPYSKSDLHDKYATYIGLRGVGGISYLSKNSRLETFGEVALLMDVIPVTGAALGIGAGIRYYF